MKLTGDIVYELYAEYLTGLRRSEARTKQKKRSIRMFYESLSKSNKDDLRDATKDDILNYAKFLDEYKRRDRRAGNVKALSRRSKQGLMRDIKVMFEYFYVSGYLLENVFDKMDQIDFRGVDGIRKVFSKDEMTRFLDCIETNSFYGLRSRVIFELIYSSGLRLMEAVKLDVGDINLDTREALIRCSKFKKDRVVPISEVAEKFLRKYLEKTKLIRKDKKALFLRSEGIRIGYKGITHYFERYIKKALLEGKGYTVHSIRHATATHLLESGADIRYVQELLGHEKPDTTVKYTHLMLESLKKVYRTFHPRCNEYYREVDSEYLSKVNYLKERLLKDREKKRRWKRKERI